MQSRMSTTLGCSVRPQVPQKTFCERTVSTAVPPELFRVQKYRKGVAKMKGRPRTSDEEKKNKGTFQPIRAENQSDIVPLSRMPVVPDWICDEGKGIWREYGPNLLRKGLLSEQDLFSFETLCHNWGMYKKLIIEMAKGNDTPTIVQPNGIEGINPKLKAAHECLKIGNELAKHFGLTPATRKLVPAKKDEVSDPVGDLLRGKTA